MRTHSSDASVVSDHSDNSGKYSGSVIARLIQRLALDQSVNLTELAQLAGVGKDVLEQCRAGHVSLPPETQIRVATAVLTIAPEHAGRAHAVYARAQAALRYAAGGVGLHIEQSPTREAARGAVRSQPARMIDLEDTWKRCEAVIESARALRQATNHLAAETHRIVAKHRQLTAEDAGFLRHCVEGLARILRECGAPPERALVLVKSEVQPLIAAAAPDGVLMTEQVVRWFVDAYYAA